MQPNRKCFVLTSLVFIAAVLFAAPAQAASSVVHDATGDASTAYQDIVTAKVTEQRGSDTFLFLTVVAEPVPGTFPAGTLRIWAWTLDTVPGIASPQGGPAEWVVIVRWRAGAFEAVLANRTGTTTSEQPIAFAVEGATVRAFVDSSLLGSPSSFLWRGLTRTAAFPPAVDLAPDNDVFVPWTR